MLASAKSIVNDPTLPMNIVKIINILPILLIDEVIPNDKPTVPKAETVSNSIVKKSCAGSVSDNIIVPLITTNSPIKTTANDLFTAL